MQPLHKHTHTHANATHMHRHTHACKRYTNTHTHACKRYTRINEHTTPHPAPHPPPPHTTTTHTHTYNTIHTWRRRGTFQIQPRGYWNLPQAASGGACCVTGSAGQETLTRRTAASQGGHCSHRHRIW